MEYDVALSFAGEDREYVEAVANELKNLGVKVFYDSFETVDLWGKDLYTHLQNIYQKQAKYTVIFISQHYGKKLWTNHERKMAQARAFTESSEYILPARFDTTEIEGITQTIGYIDLSQYSPKSFANLIFQKLNIPPAEEIILTSESFNLENEFGTLDEDEEQIKYSEIERFKYLEKSESEIEQIKYLEKKDTNFIFLFGKVNTGKTSIITSLIYFLASNTSVGLYSSISNPRNKRLTNYLLEFIKKKQFPDRTTTGTVSHLDITFVPIKNSFKPLNLTFLEMSGEDLRCIEMPEYESKFPSNIDVFFKANNLSINFILVTSHDYADSDDLFITNFLGYLSTYNSKFQKSKILLLITKWDNYTGNLTVEDFVKETMPLTYARLYNTARIRNFSLGTITDVDNRPYIKIYDNKSASQLFHWIYYSFTGSWLLPLFKRILIRFGFRKHP